MPQRRLANLASEIRAFARPIAKRAAEAMRGDVAMALLAQEAPPFALTKRPAVAWKDVRTVAEGAYLSQYLDATWRQRHPVLTAGLHTFLRYRPRRGREVDLVPSRAAHLSATSCC